VNRFNEVKCIFTVILCQHESIRFLNRDTLELLKLLCRIDFWKQKTFRMPPIFLLSLRGKEKNN
jgi:hypothetical protein